MVQPETTASFGYWVRRQRLALDLTQADLARTVGCATVTISKIERDERRPSRQMAELLAEHLAVPDEERERFMAAALGEQSPDRMALPDQPVASAEAALDPLPTNLPKPSTPFVGRDAELEQLFGRLEDSACRLLTLVGPGGFGKTRLSIRLGELALTRPDLFPDGVFFVALEALEDATLVIPAIAWVLDLTFFEQQAQEEQLISYLTHRRLLLILDNAEGILDAGLVNRILSRTDGVTCLVTSREALKLRQEWFHAVRGMTVYTQQATQEVDIMHDGSDVGDSDAVTLFQHCAQRARSDFDPEQEAAHVRRICALVEGSPLAIELAAAWVRTIPCAQIAQALAGSMDLLSATFTDLPPRHRSMRAVLQQSWSYLTADEQRVFRQLSVFAGGFQADAAITVADATFPILAALVERSVLQLQASGRYRLHALLRQFAVEQLSINLDETASVQARHSAFFMETLAERSEMIDGPDQQAVLRQIQGDLDNIRVAWRYAAQHGHVSLSRHAMDCLFRFLWLRGRYAEGVEMAAQALAPDDDGGLAATQESLHTALMVYSAQFASAVGAYREALARLDMVLAQALRLHDVYQQMRCHAIIGMVHDHMGQGDQAVDSLRAAYDLARTLGLRRERAEIALALGYSSYNFHGDFAQSRTLFEESLPIFQSVGDRASVGDALDHLAWMKWVDGDLDGAEETYRQSLDIGRELGHRFLEARAIGGLGLIAWTRAEWEPAIDFMQQRLALMEEIGHENQVKGSLNFLCGVYVHAARYADAMALLDARPEMWMTPWTAQAQIGTGRFAQALAYLPEETAAKLTAEHGYDLAHYLVAWAMLLCSDAKLVQASDDGARVPMTRLERDAYAIELLQALLYYAHCEPITRNEAARWLARLHGSPIEKDERLEIQIDSVQTIVKLANAVLTIHLD